MLVISVASPLILLLIIHLCFKGSVQQPLRDKVVEGLLLNSGSGRQRRRNNLRSILPGGMSQFPPEHMLISDDTPAEHMLPFDAPVVTPMDAPVDAPVEHRLPSVDAPTEHILPPVDAPVEHSLPSVDVPIDTSVETPVEHMLPSCNAPVEHMPPPVDVPIDAGPLLQLSNKVGYFFYHTKLLGVCP